MSKGELKIATCQFAVSSSIKRNALQIKKFMFKASKAKADIVHFSECTLSGYAGADLSSFENFNWQLLKQQTEEIMALAAKLGIWVILGSMHPLTSPNKPHNCLYLINPKGRIENRYDKRFCTLSDLKFYTPGNSFAYFTINGVRCSVLICFDLRFPQLYSQLYKQGVDCIFQSFYNARQNSQSVHTHIMRQTMQCHAATNHFWISVSNCSAYYSPYPSCFIQPDGRIINQLKNNHAGIMINSVDKSQKFYDPMKEFRNLAVKGCLNNASRKIKDVRSEKKNIL